MHLSSAFLQSAKGLLTNEGVKILNDFSDKEVNLYTICEMRDKLEPFGGGIGMKLWEEGCKIIPGWKHHFKDERSSLDEAHAFGDIHNFLDKFVLREDFLDDLIDALNWVCAMDEDQKCILDDFVETLEIHSNYIDGAVSMIDFKNEIMLLRNVIIRFHDEHKTWYHADNKLFKVLYDAISKYTVDSYEEFMSRELDDFMKDHLWNKLVQRLAMHLQTEVTDDFAYNSYMDRIKSITGDHKSKLYQLEDIIESIPVMHTVVVDGEQMSSLMEVAWRYGMQLICN